MVQISKKNKKKPVVILDIDYTVFHTTSFRRNLYEHLARKLNFLDERKFFKLAKEIERQTITKENYFNPRVFLSLLKESVQTNISSSELESLFFDESLYIESLYEDARSLFQELVIKNDIPVIIFSTGEKNFHMQKLAVFQEMLQEDQTQITIGGITRLKEVLMLYTKYDIYFVDDLPTILNEAKQYNSDITTIWINGDKKVTEKDFVGGFKADYIIENLVEIATIVIAN